MVIDPNDIEPLEQRHREAMLDLVLAWGSLDGALGMLLSSARGQPLEEGAEQFSTLRSSAKLEEVCKVLKNSPGGAGAARTLKKYKKKFERHSQSRNRIAHSHCLGIWTRDPEFIVFLPFEKFADGELACEAIPLQKVRYATQWGYQMKKIALRLEEAFSREA